MSESLPPYSGRYVFCPKCGGRGASTQYLERGVCRHPDQVIDGESWAANPRLHRQCDACGYQWDEASLDPKDWPEDDPRRAVSGPQADETGSQAYVDTPDDSDAGETL